MKNESSTSSEFFLTKFHETKSNYPQHIDIYMDGFKIGDEVAAAVVSKHHYQQIRLPNKSSIFLAESQAILLALEYIATSKHNIYSLIRCPSWNT